MDFEEFYMSAKADLDEAQYEIERLRAELVNARRTAEGWKAEHIAGNGIIDVLKAELAEADELHKEDIDRLKAELAEANRIGDIHFAKTLKQERELAALKARPAQREPVAFANSDELDNMIDDRWATVAGVRDGWRNTPLYLTPQPNAEVERDAARYRWLRRDDLEYEQCAFIFDTHSMEELDAAIDLAMKKGA